MLTNTRGVSRRRILQTGGMVLSAAGLSGAGNIDHAINTKLADSPSATAVPILNRFPTAVQRYFMAQLREVDEKRRRRLEGITTKSGAEAYVREVREKIRTAFGPLPEKTPLNAKITGVLDRDSYRIEKVIFESRPGFLVTANLYIPKGLKSPAPGVVGACGHTAEGKAAETYQAFSQGLARLGYVVLIFDPIGQGERLQYLDAQGKSSVGIGVREHIVAGSQQSLVGEFFGAWRAWDGIRALDYLLTRPEVDSRHLGITGNSGGGTVTTWLCGLDNRWTMAAASCFITSFRRNLENELPADTEQCPPKALALGLDHEDFVAAMAPKPVIILAQEKDYFDVRGTEEAYERLARLYDLLGARDNISLFIGPTEHGFTVENREAMYRWFNRVTGISSADREPKLTLEKPEDLNCTPEGQVARLGSRSVFSFTAERSKELARKRGTPEGENLKQAVRAVLRLPALPPPPPPYRILRTIEERGYPKKSFTTYVLETEPEIQVAVYRLSEARHQSRPPPEPEGAILYVSDQSADLELRTEPLVKQLLQEKPNFGFFACDLRGTGESRPNTCGENTYYNLYGNDFFYAAHSLMLDRPYVGQKTFDLLSTIEWLKDFAGNRIVLAAKGWGTVPATFAALLSDSVSEVTLKNAPTSYSAVAESEKYSWPVSILVHGILKEFDLPDCYRALSAKHLRQLEPRGSQFGVDAKS
ncbi:MAG TPA: acetylxylan esterase [Acidobacteriota bacterium]|nr:acetylxylan esterase [Acidobacteriota bacterium]